MGTPHTDHQTDHQPVLDLITRLERAQNRLLKRADRYANSKNYDEAARAEAKRTGVGLALSYAREHLDHQPSPCGRWRHYEGWCGFDHDCDPSTIGETEPSCDRIRCTNHPITPLETTEVSCG